MIFHRCTQGHYQLRCQPLEHFIHSNSSICPYLFLSVSRTPLKLYSRLLKLPTKQSRNLSLSFMCNEVKVIITFGLLTLCDTKHCHTCNNNKIRTKHSTSCTLPLLMQENLMLELVQTLFSCFQLVNPGWN